MELSKTLMVVCLIFTTTSFFSQDYAEMKPAIDHMKIINDQWEGKEDFVPNEFIAFNSDEERIEYHLKHVIDYLSQVDPSDWPSEVLQKRSRLIESLDLYAEAKNFPQNNHHAERTPYFIDDFGTHCAVGQLMKNSGNGDLAREIKSEYNFNYLEDIHNPKIQEWANEFGFTFDELAWIQPDYPPERKHDYIDGGVNGTVKKLVNVSWQGEERVYFYGDFDLMRSEYLDGTFDVNVRSIPCGGLAYIEGYRLHCEESVEGQIVGLEVSDGIIEVAGSFTSNGSSFQMASKQNSVWSYFNVPGRESYEVKHYYRNWEMDQKYIVLDNGIDDQEVWVQEKSNDWVLLLNINGEILSSFFDGGLYLAGEIQSVENTFEGDELSNVCSVVKAEYCEAFGLDLTYYSSAALPESINAIGTLNEEVFFGGTSDSMADNIYLTKFSNGSFIPLITHSILEPIWLLFPMDEYVEINKIYPSNTGNLIIGGSWELFFDLYYSRGILEIDNNGNMVEQFGSFDAPVLDISHFGDNYVVAGEFENSNSISCPETSIANHITLDRCYLGVCDNNPTPESFEFIHFCEGDSILVDGQYYSESTPVNQVLATELGCDSIHQLILLQHELSMPTSDSKLTCEGDSIDLGGFYYSEAGQFDIIYEDQFGCDSLVITNINVVECGLSGCTHPVADNYNPFAVEDDGSCLFDNLSVCGLGTVWDEDLQTCVCDNCPGDFDGDDLINAADLLVFLAAFGQECSP